MTQMQEGVERPQTVVNFEVGEQVRVCDGPFASFIGLVEEVDAENPELKFRFRFSDVRLRWNWNFHRLKRFSLKLECKDIVKNRFVCRDKPVFYWKF